MCGRFKCVSWTVLDTDAFNTSQKDQLFFSPSFSVTQFHLLRSAPIHFSGLAELAWAGPWWTARSSGPNITCSLSPGAWWMEDNWQQALFYFFPAFFLFTLLAARKDILWWNKSEPIEIPAETACYLLTRYLNCGLSGVWRGKLYRGTGSSRKH